MIILFTLSIAIGIVVIIFAREKKKDPDRESFIKKNAGDLGEDYAGEFWDKYH